MTADEAGAIGTDDPVHDVQGVREEDLVIFRRTYTEGQADAVLWLDTTAGVYQTWRIIEPHQPVSLYTPAEATAYITTMLRHNDALAPSLHGDVVEVRDFASARQAGIPDVTVFAAGSHDSLYGGRLVRHDIPCFGLGGEPDGTMSIMVTTAVAEMLRTYGFETAKHTEFRIKQLLRMHSSGELLLRALDLHDIVSNALGRLHYGTAEPSRSAVTSHV